MKNLLQISTLMMLSLNLHAEMSPFSLVGKKIVSSLKDQVCQLSVNGGTEVCTGVRVSTNYILTAAHCVRDTKKDKVKSVSVSCNDKSQKVEAVFESKEYALKKNPDLNQVDFALIKIKKPKDFTPKFKLINNLAEYKSIFLNSSESSVNNFAENTYCEVHGYGMDAEKAIDVYNSASISTTSVYKGVSYFMTVTSTDTQKAFITSPHLPEKDKDWLWTSVRPGDSGGPLFCRAKSGEWVLNGIASVLRFGICDDKFQEGKIKKDCHSNIWGVPTREALESITGVRIID